MHNATQDKRMPSHQREQFDRDGYTVYRRVIDADLVAETQAHVAWLMKRHPDRRPEHLEHTFVAEDPFWIRLVGDDRLLDVAQEFVGPDIALFASHYICKPPRDGQAVLWHQDGSYWPLQPMDVVTLWLAVDASTPANGCMRVIPGTQLMDLQALQQRTDTPNVLASGMDASLVDESKAVDVVLAPGDVSVHHPNVVHGSKPNTSDNRRCGLTIRYIPTSTQVTSEEPWPCLFLLRGNAKPGVNEYKPFPRCEHGRHMPFRGSASWL